MGLILGRKHSRSEGAKSPCRTRTRVEGLNLGHFRWGRSNERWPGAKGWRPLGACSCYLHSTPQQVGRPAARAHSLPCSACSGSFGCKSQGSSTAAYKGLHCNHKTCLVAHAVAVVDVESKVVVAQAGAALRLLAPHPLNLSQAGQLAQGQRTQVCDSGGWCSKQVM